MASDNHAIGFTLDFANASGPWLDTSTGRVLLDADRYRWYCALCRPSERLPHIAAREDDPGMKRQLYGLARLERRRRSSRGRR